MSDDFNPKSIIFMLLRDLLIVSITIGITIWQMDSKIESLPVAPMRKDIEATLQDVHRMQDHINILEGRLNDSQRRIEEISTKVEDVRSIKNEKIEAVRRYLPNDIDRFFDERGY